MCVCVCLCVTIEVQLLQIGWMENLLSGMLWYLSRTFMCLCGRGDSRRWSSSEQRGWAAWCHSHCSATTVLHSCSCLEALTTKRKSWQLLGSSQTTLSKTQHNLKTGPLWVKLSELNTEPTLPSLTHTATTQPDQTKPYPFETTPSLNLNPPINCHPFISG